MLTVALKKKKKKNKTKQNKTEKFLKNKNKKTNKKCSKMNKPAIRKRIKLSHFSDQTIEAFNMQKGQSGSPSRRSEDDWP